MPVESGIQPFVLQQHVERGTQSEKMMGRRSAAESEIEFFRLDSRVPVPVPGSHVRVATDALGAFIEKQKANSRRRHQPLLTCRQHHVDVPVVHPESLATQTRNAVDHQQRGVAGFFDSLRERLDVVAHGTRSVHLHGKHGFDGVRRITGQALSNHCRINRSRRPEFNAFHLGSDISCHTAPGISEQPRGQCQDSVASAQRIRKTRFPCAVPIRDVNRGMTASAGDRLQIGDGLDHHVLQIGGVNVRCRSVHGGQHLVGNNGRSGNCYVFSACGKIHVTISKECGLTRNSLTTPSGQKTKYGRRLEAWFLRNKFRRSLVWIVEDLRFRFGAHKSKNLCSQFGA